MRPWILTARHPGSGGVPLRHSRRRVSDRGGRSPARRRDAWGNNRSVSRSLPVPSQTVQELGDMIRMVFHSESSFDPRGNLARGARLSASSAYRASLFQKSNQSPLLLQGQPWRTTWNGLGLQCGIAAAPPGIPPAQHAAGVAPDLSCDLAQRKVFLEHADRLAAPLLQIAGRSPGPHGASSFHTGALALMVALRATDCARKPMRVCRPPLCRPSRLRHTCLLLSIARTVARGRRRPSRSMSVGVPATFFCGPPPESHITISVPDSQRRILRAAMAARCDERRRHEPQSTTHRDSEATRDHAAPPSSNNSGSWSCCRFRRS